ncbi:MAM domain-containing glycosylphosphatidylinositol anchor protein 1 [Chanos chanos]|uniref:MAM domain-containing glycosylphosphatidylinositol anchor protein 1 n=1 Tax=Chanos chanos TaxID=29144 RepID=A0A6J2V8E1_CHACN|nr:MAM domain-containing glycosylphosphatidylinositol anchor protein 1-like [Chanos chanos]
MWRHDSTSNVQWIREVFRVVAEVSREEELTVPSQQSPFQTSRTHLPANSNDGSRVKMELSLILLFVIYKYARGQGVYAPANAQIVHAGQACVVKEDNISERVYTIRENDTLVLQCLVKGHPRPQVRWTKTAGSASDKFQETYVFNEILRIDRIQRVQGGRYYCKAENGVGVAAIKSIRVDVQYLDEPVLTVHQTVSDVRGNYYQEKTVFLRCTVNSNPPARFIWKRGDKQIEQSKDNGVDIYEPLYTQGETKVLKLKNLRPQDFANYTCQVSVRKVCDIPDTSVTFLLTNATTPPALRLNVNETYVVDPGRDVTLSCEVTAGFPKPVVTWSRYPGPLPRRAVVRRGSLTLQSVSPADSGFYNCTAVNNVGNPARRNVNLIIRTMKNLTFQITPDPNKDSESIQMGRDLKISCHVDAQPQDKVNYTWYKNGVPIQPSDSLILLRSDPDMPSGTSSLEIVEMKFRDQATYSCVAKFPGSSVPELRVDVNITQSSVTPPVLSVPVGGAVVNVSEGGVAELVCLVDGKPRPPVLWSRANKDLPMPSGDWIVETRDGHLRLTNISRDLMGDYRCQTAPYNGLNIKRRFAQVKLNVEYAPIVDPVSKDVRSPNYQTVILRCTVLKANPSRLASVRWYRNGVQIRTPTVDLQDVPPLRFKLDPTNNGTYECRIFNGVGSSSCTFNVSARPYSAEFYYDTPNPIRILKGNNYSYNLQWTQKEPGAVDRVIGYWISVRQNGQRVLSRQINVKEPVKGVLMSYTLIDLRIPLSYEVGLTPITTFVRGDTITRIIRYSEPYTFLRPSDHVCGFEDSRICGYSQDRTDDFDWTRQSFLSQNPKRSGPATDRRGTKEGYYMYIETSQARKKGDRARLLSPLYNVTVARGPTGSTRLPYCISFYYHMNGRQIGTLNVLLRVNSIATVSSLVWTRSASQGPSWKKANVEIYPSGAFRVIFEGIREDSFEGHIAIADVAVTKGKCKQDSVSNTGLNTTGVLDSADAPESSERQLEKVYAPHPADIYSGFYTLFVYTDIIQHQAVGDYFVPLLRCVHISGKSNEIVTIRYEKAHYVPVSKSHINDIAIEVKTDQDEKVPFRYSGAYGRNGPWWRKSWTDKKSRIYKRQQRGGAVDTDP